MAMPPSSPPNPLPSSTATTSAATTTSTTTTAIRIFPNPQQPSAARTPIHHFTTAATYPSHRPLHHHSNYPNIAPRIPQLIKPHDAPPHAPPAQGFPYPLASSGRGFLPKPITVSDQTTAMANPSGFPPRPYASNPGRMAYGCQPLHLIRPTHLQNSLHASSGGVVKGIPISTHPKAGASPSSVSDCNGYKDTRDRVRDDNFAIVRDRKVRISDGASLYAQCRSWLRNGYPEESQPQYLDGVKSLPRPMPTPVGEAHSPQKRERDNEEDDGDVEQLSPKELLQRHIKRAKKVRARLREERLQRIARYKARLALLLPPLVEQQLRNDMAAGN